tara:strand:- start:280 stop:3786 length:3507 start_codon:yes stop_codon:yes gene_type:complete
MATWKKIIVSGSDADLNNITAIGNISSSGLLFISTSDATTNPYLTVLIDTSSGRLYYTGSYGGGGDGGVSNYTELTNIPSNILSSSAQISTEISGAFNIHSSSFSARIGNLESTDRIFNNITSSGNISASGDLIISGTGSLGKLTLGTAPFDDSLTKAKFTIHSGNSESLFRIRKNTNILFDIDSTGKIRHDVSNVPFTLGENQQISFGHDSSSKSFQIVNGQIINENVLFSISQSGNIGIGTTTPTALLEVAGVISASSISASGVIQATTFVGDGSNLTGIGSVDALNEFTSSIQSEINGIKLATSSYATLNDNNSFNQITASGNISASGIIIGSNLTGSNTGDQDLTSYLISSLTSSFITTGSDISVLFNNITASGDISASALKINQISASSLTASNVLINEDLNLDGNFIFQGVQFNEVEAAQFTGSTTFGSGSNNTHTFTGSIIGSGSSFNFVGNTFTFNSDTFLKSLETSSLLTTSSFQELLDATGSFIITGSDQNVLFNDITSSGTISASGDLILSGTASINKIIVSTLPDGPLDRTYTNAKLSIHSEFGDFFSLYNSTNKLFNISSSGDVSTSGSLKVDVGQKTISLGSISDEGVHADISTDAGSLFLQMNGGNLIQFGADAIPSATLTKDLGSLTRLWDKLYVNDISASGIIVSNQLQAFYDGHLRDIINFSASLGLLKLGNDVTNTIIRSKNDLILSSSNTTTILSNLTASGDISASGLLYISASDANGNFSHTVLIDTSSGQLYYTSSLVGAGGGGVSYNATQENGIDVDLNNITFNNFDPDLVIGTDGGQLTLTFGTPPEPEFLSFYSPTNINGGFNTDRFTLENDDYTLRVDYNLNGSTFNEGTIFVNNEQVTTFAEGDESELIAINSSNFPSLASGSHTFTAKLNSILADGNTSEDKQKILTLNLSKTNPGTPTITKTPNILPSGAIISSTIEEGATGSIVYNVNSGGSNNWSAREITIDSVTGQYTFSNTNGGSNTGIITNTTNVSIDVNPTGNPQSNYIFQNWKSPDGANSPDITRRLATSPSRVSYSRQRSFRYGTGTLATLGDFNALGGASYLRDLAIWTQTHGTIEFGVNTKSEIQNLGDFNLDGSTANDSGKYFYLVFDKNAGTLKKITNLDTNLNEINSFSGPHTLSNYYMYISNIRYSSYSFNLTFN